MAVCRQYFDREFVGIELNNRIKERQALKIKGTTVKTCYSRPCDEILLFLIQRSVWNWVKNGLGAEVPKTQSGQSAGLPKRTRSLHALQKVFVRISGQFQLVAHTWNRIAAR
jgi:hypothetical protein